MSGSPWSSVGVNDDAGLPVPRPSTISKPHWDACREGRLLIQHCASCDSHIFPPEFACPSCFTEAPEWIESSGRGTVYSFTVVSRPQRPEFEAPYVVAIIQLEEGCYMLSNIVDCEPDAVTIGAPVVVHFVARGDMVMPMFHLVDRQDNSSNN